MNTNEVVAQRSHRANNADDSWPAHATVSYGYLYEPSMLIRPYGILPMSVAEALSVDISKMLAGDACLARQSYAIIDANNAKRDAGLLMIISDEVRPQC